MLNFIRSNKAAGWIKVMFGLIVFVFMFWGVGVGVSGSQTPMVAEVNGETIEQIEFERAQRNLYNLYRQIYQDNPELLETVDLRGQAVDQLLRVMLLRQEAERIGLGVADSEVRSQISANQNFQVDGLFSKDRYLRVLRLNQLTPAQYEDSIREELIVNKLRDLVGGGVHVSTAEVRETFLRDNAKVALRYIALEADDFTEGVEVTDAEAQAYFEENETEFRQPDRVRIAYARFHSSNFVDGVAIDDAAIEKYYDENAGEFDEPEQVNARHILFRVESGASDESKAEVRARAEEVLAKVKAGDDFAALAAEFSEDQSNASRGGDLGLFPKGRMVPPFEEAAFGLEAGQTSDLVETSFGFHIIKVEEKRESGVRPLAEVRGRIHTKLRSDEAGKAAEAAATDALEKAKGGVALESVAQEYGIEVKTTEPVGRGELVAGIRGSPALVNAAMDADEGDFGPAVTTIEGVFVFRVAERIDSHTPELATVIEDVNEAVRARKAVEVAAEKAEELRARVANEGLDAVAAAEGLEIEATEEFPRAGAWVQGIGVSRELKDAAFELAEEGDVAPEVYEVSDKQIIAVLKQRSAPSDEEFESQKDTLVRSLEARRRNEVVAAFLEDLKSKASIEMGRAYADLG